MSYACPAPQLFRGTKVGSGECVEFVQVCAGAPFTGNWKRGPKVKENLNLKVGTAIATFGVGGRYLNHSTGNHAAIYVGQDANGIWVYDQYRKKGAVSKRQIRFKGGSGSPSDDGDAYFVIE